jgi:MAF protein
VDESNPGLSAPDLATYLAEKKAQTVSLLHRDAICIGGDQVPYCQGQIINKPVTLENNIVQLQQFSGQRVTFYGGLCVLYPPKHIRRVSLYKTSVLYRTLTLEQIERYVEKEPALDCAGALKLEGLGISLIASIDGGTDVTALMGMSLIQLVDDLRLCGVDI